MKKSICGIYLVFTGLFLYIFNRVPYCHDEWAWGLPSRIDMMKNGFDGYNGRYFGNLLAILITRSIVAKTVLLALCMTGLLLIVEKVIGVDSKKRVFFLLSLILIILAIPKTLFNQTYGWVAAFVNFVPPVLIFLIYFEFVAKKTLCEETGSISILTTVTMVPLCIIAQLFSEHNTIFHVLFAGGVIVYGLVKTKKVKIADALALCSFAVGALIMFSNSAYHAAADNTDGYKQISFSLRTMLECYVDDMSDHLFLNNWILNGILVILLVTLLVYKLKNRILTSELMLVLIGYEVYSIWHKVYPEWVFFGNEFYDDCIRAFLGILFWVHVVLAILLVVDESEKKKVIIFYLSAVVVAGPLLMANPIGSRCFYVSYIFQAIAVLLILKSISAKIQIDYFYAVVAVGVACMVICFIYFWMFREIGRYNDVRSQIIDNAIKTNEKSIELPLLPYSDYFWTTEPQTERWEKRFKKFYGLSEDVTVVFQ